MTVIAFDGRTLAADKRVMCFGHATTTTKIERVSGTGELLAISGSLDTGRALMEWYKRGQSRYDYPNNAEGDDCRTVLLVIHTDGSMSRYEREPFPMRIEETTTAMGSGRDYALAAMHLGHDARKAVEVACALDTGCGNGIDVLELNPQG
jgi:ATP-dependent protease HslVU (ClpYQ) peptidase subunit